MATSSGKVPDLGDVVVSDEAQLRRFLEAVREVIQTREGSRGTELQRSALMSDLVNFGLITRVGGGGGRYVGVVNTGPPGPPGGAVIPDLTPSADAEFIDVVEGFSYLIVRWVAPTYTHGHGHAYTEVWAAQYSGTGPLPTFSNATLVSKEIANIYAHQAGLGVQVHFWLVNVSNDGVAQTTPTGGLNGVWGTTRGVPVDHLLNVLTGQITESQLYGALTSRIGLVDGFGAGSVNARIAVETSYRAALDGAVHSLYTVRAAASADGRTIVGGFGLSASGLSGEGPSIDFGVSANTFWVAAPFDGTTKPAIRPFIVRTTAETENGVLIPPGVYMDAAYIVNLVAVYGKMKQLVADDIIAADIEVVKLKAGYLRVGGYLRSTNYVPGSSGWSISDTTSEFNSATFRGDLDVGGTAIINGNNSGVTVPDQISPGSSFTATAALVANTGWAQDIGAVFYSKNAQGSGRFAGAVGVGVNGGTGLYGIGQYGVTGYGQGAGIGVSGYSDGAGEGVKGHSFGPAPGVRGTSESGFGGRFSSLKVDAGTETAGLISTNGFVEAKTGAYSAYLHAPASGGAYFGHWNGSALQWGVYSDTSNNTTVEKLRMNNMTVVTPGSFGSDYVEVMINGVVRKLAIIP